MALDLDSERIQSKEKLNNAVQLDGSGGTLLMVRAGLSISTGLRQPEHNNIIDIIERGGDIYDFVLKREPIR